MLLPRAAPRPARPGMCPPAPDSEAEVYVRGPALANRRQRASDAGAGARPGSPRTGPLRTGDTARQLCARANRGIIAARHPAGNRLSAKKAMDMGARKLLLVWLLAASLSALMWACRGPTVVPDHLTPLPSGAGALRKVIDIAAMPDFETAYNQRDRGLVDAVDRSLTWFATSAARQRYPSHGIPFDVAHAGVFAFRQLLAADVSPQSFRQTLLSEFDVYSSVGSDQRGGVLFTGYYSPVFPASTRRTE